MAYNVVILGASEDPERYSNKAMHLLQQYQHKVFLVHPKLSTIEGHPVFSDLDQIKDRVHTLTVYVRPELSSPLRDKILRLAPQRVIFNPGTENPTLAKELEERGIKTEEACTLVLLKTDQF